MSSGSGVFGVTGAENVSITLLRARFTNHKDGDCQGYPYCLFCRQEHLGLKVNLVFAIVTHPRATNRVGVKGWAVVSIGHLADPHAVYVVRAAGMPMLVRNPLTSR